MEIWAGMFPRCSKMLYCGPNEGDLDGEGCDGGGHADGVQVAPLVGCMCMVSSWMQYSTIFYLWVYVAMDDLLLTDLGIFLERHILSSLLDVFGVRISMAPDFDVSSPFLLDFLLLAERHDFYYYYEGRDLFSDSTFHIAFFKAASKFPFCYT
jgi:hypothetical protein